MGLVQRIREFVSYNTEERSTLRKLRAQESKLRLSIVESVSDVFDNLVDTEDEFEGWLRLNDERYFDAATNAPNLASMRRTVRRCVWQSGIAQGGLQAVADYVVGTGLTYKFAPPRGTPPEDADEWKELIAKANAVWEEFSEANEWPILENDLVRLMHRDGDSFVRFFDTRDGVKVRSVDADDVRDPGDGKTDAPWGIEVDPIDQQTPIRYFVEGEPVPAAEIVHLKVNADPSVPRGVPTLWSVRNNVIRAERLVRNMARLGEIQAAIAIVREHQYPISGDKIKNVLDAAADKTPVDPYTGKTKRQQKLQEGSIVDVSGGTKLTFPTVGTSLTNYPPAIQAVLRPVAARLGITEFMLTADASNAAYASTFVALAPVVKSLQSQQARVMAKLRAVPYMVIRNAVKLGLLELKALKLICAISPPEVSNRDELQQANIREIEKRNGVLSVQSWSADSGRDYDEEQRQIAEHNLSTGGVDENPLSTNDPLSTSTPAAPGVPAPASGADPAQASPATATVTPGIPAQTAAVAGPKQEIQVQTDLVLNGAQISAAKDIVLAVAAGELPRDSGLGMLQTFFNLTPEKAASIMGSAGTSTPTTPNPNPADKPEPSPPAPGGPPIPPNPNADQQAAA